MSKMLCLSQLVFFILLNSMAFSQRESYRPESDRSDRLEPTYDEIESSVEEESGMSDTDYGTVSTDGEVTDSAVAESEEYPQSEDNYEPKVIQTKPNKKVIQSLPMSDEINGNKYNKKPLFADTGAGADSKAFKNISNKKLSEKKLKKTKRFAFDQNSNIENVDTDVLPPPSAKRVKSLAKVTHSIEPNIAEKPSHFETKPTAQPLKPDPKTEETNRKKSVLKSDQKYNSNVNQKTDQKSGKYSKMSKKYQKKSSDRQKRSFGYFGYWA